MKGCAGRKASPKFGGIRIHRCVHSASRCSSKAVDETASADRKENKKCLNYFSRNHFCFKNVEYTFMQKARQKIDK
jgi:hypothetical protein